MKGRLLPGELWLRTNVIDAIHLRDRRREEGWGDWPVPPRVTWHELFIPLGSAAAPSLLSTTSQTLYAFRVERTFAGGSPAIAVRAGYEGELQCPAPRGREQ